MGDSLGSHGSAETSPLLANDNHRPDHQVKGELLDRLRADGWEPIMAFDDRNQVVRMWREKGIPCAQVADGDF